MAGHIEVQPARVTVQPLSKDAFAPFGTVICNSLDTDQMRARRAPYKCYIRESSRSSRTKDGVAVMNMFSCLPRQLRNDKTSTFVESRTISFRKDLKTISKYLFDVKILERHPFTFQTFVPISLSYDDTTTAYLVIVAPTLRNDSTAEAAGPKGTGPPDLKNIKAFLARGDQAVTYAAGTWHAPMVVLGSHRVDFVVSQFANGIADDDCQEVHLLLRILMKELLWN